MPVNESWSNDTFFPFLKDGHTVKDVIYNWRRDEVVVEKKEIAQFDLKSVQLNSSNASYISGE